MMRNRQITVFFMLVVAMHYGRALPTPSGVNFIGIGYNILDGNPEGGDLSSGGVDPGLNVGRHVFLLTYDDGRTSSDRQYSIPDEVTFVHRSSAFTTSSRRTFYGTSSYTSKLSAQVDVSGSYDGLFASTRFAASTRYQNIQSRVSSQGSVYFATETISNLGHARYRTELASHDSYELDRGFAAAACSLTNQYDRDNYMDFIDDWGTHVTTEVDLGTRSGINYEEQRSSFVNYASNHISSSLRASGSYGPFSASVAVNMDVFNSQLTTGMSFGSEYSRYNVGSTSLNEPISLTMMTMNEVFDNNYWTGLNSLVSDDICDSDWSLASVKANMLTALQGYADWRTVVRSSNPQIIIPLVWPDGTYGLPKPQSGCPNRQFTWDGGRRKHDTEDDNSNNYWSSSLHLAGYWGRNNIEHQFCMKTVSSVNNYVWNWQPGSYCIYKRGNCPSGFSNGYVYWDDEDSRNSNSYSGVVPDGSYNRNTKIYFCCRNDGPTNRAIYLPTDNNFYLFPRFGSCQQVNGMSVTDEYFRWDNEDDDNNDHESGAVPNEGVHSSGHNVVLHFCYYVRQ